MKSQRRSGIPVPPVEKTDVRRAPREPVPLGSLCRRLQQLQARAKALGIFTDERNLLTCPNCGLFEDVTFDGFLITSRTLSKEPLDTGLRFRETAPDTYCCPSCQSEVRSSNGRDEQVESKTPTRRPQKSKPPTGRLQASKTPTGRLQASKAPTGRPHDSPGHRPGAIIPTKSKALKGRNKGGAA